MVSRLEGNCPRSRVGNGFAPGIELSPAQMSRKLIEHQMECALELFKSDRELYGEDDAEVKEVKESEELPIAGESEEQQGGDGPAPEHAVGEAPIQDLASKSSPLSKGSSVRSPQPSLAERGRALASPSAHPGGTRIRMASPKKIRRRRFMRSREGPGETQGPTLSRLRPSLTSGSRGRPIG